jgi:acylphosphatase
MAKKAYEIKVFGKVQGVGFRYYTQKKAYELNLKGFVQNKPDGSVYIEAEGMEDNIEQFILWCNDGPSWARVSKVQLQEIPASGYQDFQIK